VGYGKANEVPESIRKGSEGARRNLEPIKLKGDTIPHEVLGEADGGRVLCVLLRRVQGFSLVVEFVPCLKQQGYTMF
jgi:ribosomal protein S5